MIVKVGTFNLNNLFFRFNFSGAVRVIQSSGCPTGAVTVRYEFTDPDNLRIQTFLGQLVKAKDPSDIETIAERILTINFDVLAVQEVETIHILKEFNRGELGGLYKHEILLEGNDPRFINLGILSKLPVGPVTTYQTATHPEEPSRPVFSRGLLEVEILRSDRTVPLFTFYNTHLKSHFGDEDNGGQGKVRNDTFRRRQAETIQRLIAAKMSLGSRYILAGDMNDPPDAKPLESISGLDGSQMDNALANPVETRPAKEEASGNDPMSPAWTHRLKKSGQPPTHHLFDQIWLSPALAPSLLGSFIDRRTKHGGDGSDHDPAWIELDL